MCTDACKEAFTRQDNRFQRIDGDVCRKRPGPGGRAPACVRHREATGQPHCFIMVNYSIQGVNCLHMRNVAESKIAG